MNKQELIDEVADELGGGVTKQDVERTLEAFTRVVGTNLRQGEPVQLVGFGTFEPRKRAARTARNPQTGAPVKVPASTTPVFKAGQPLKDYVAGKSGGAARFKGEAGAKKSSKKAAGKKAASKKAASKKAASKKAASKKAAGKKAAKAGKTATKQSAKKATKKAAKKSAKKSSR